MAQLYIFQFFLPCVVFSRSENENEGQYEFVCLVKVRMTCSAGGKLLVSTTKFSAKVAYTGTRFT